MKTTKILVFSSTRADFGIYLPLLKKLQNHSEFELAILATGSHLIAEAGATVREIRSYHFNEVIEIPFKGKTDSPMAITQVMGWGLIEYSQFLVTTPFDLAFVLGDRFETLAFALSCYNLRIPLAHLHGGELTFGALDEGYRHSITKLSHLHFTATALAKKRVEQLGEQPNRVFHVGALAIDNIKELPLLNRTDLEQQLNHKFNKINLVMTYHPETLGSDQLSPMQQIKNIFKALAVFEEKNKNQVSVFITEPNVDPGHQFILNEIRDFTKNHSWAKSYTSLGVLKYLSLVKSCHMVLGNSSSGIIEAPSLKTVTINIGDRQQGRERATSVIDCKCTEPEILNALTTALQKTISATFNNPYGDGQTADQIVKILLENITKLDSAKTGKIFNDQH